MHGINQFNQYMIPLDSIQSVDVLGSILSVLFVGVIVATPPTFAAALLCLGNNSKVITAVAVTVGIIAMSVAGYCTVQSGGQKSIDTSKINDEYGITVTSMDWLSTEKDGESHRLRYLHDGAMINGTLIIKDHKVGLFSGTGDKLTPVKPRSVDNESASPTTTNTTEPSKPRQTTRSRTSCYVKSYNKNGSIKELAGDCPAAPTH